MKQEDVIDLFRKAGALLDGHFIYTSGRHGSQFLQAARVLQNPEYTETLCKALAEPYHADGIDLVIGPATGGIILAYETARHLNCRAAFTEKDETGDQALKRGFALPQGTKVFVVEDIITTGGSVKKTLAHLQHRGANIAGVSVLIDRSGGQAKFDSPYKPLATLNMQSYDPKNCPLCQSKTPLIEPDDLLG